MTALIERLEALTGPDREADAAVWLLVTPGATRKETVVPANEKCKGWTIDETRDATGRLVIVPDYTASIDAAMTLTPNGLSFNMGNDTFNWCHIWDDRVPYDGRPFVGRAATPAIALCIAALKARTPS